MGRHPGGRQLGADGISTFPLIGMTARTKNPAMVSTDTRSPVAAVNDHFGRGAETSLS